MKKADRTLSHIVHRDTHYWALCCAADEGELQMREEAYVTCLGCLSYDHDNPYSDHLCMVGYLVSKAER